MEGELLKCDKCPRTFRLREFFEKHCKVHLMKKQFTCIVCGFVYGASKGLEGHMKSHTPLEIFEAERVKDEVESSIALKVVGDEDVNSENQSPLPQLPQFMSYRYLNSEGSLAASQKDEDAQNQKQSEYTSSYLVAMSNVSNDLSKSPEAASITKLKSDMKAVTKNVPKDEEEITDASMALQNDSGFFMCHICGREFSGLNSLKKHIPIHTRRVQHRCEVCGFVFGKKEYLHDHMRKHTGEESPMCEICGQTFNKSLKLKEHGKLHRNTSTDGQINESMPFKCHHCQQIFAHSDGLTVHLKTLHNKSLYRCDMCGATFGDVRGKNHHLYNEHQMDAFHSKCVWCPVCNQGFTRHYNLKVHMYKAHGRDFVENNFTATEQQRLFKPPPGTSSNMKVSAPTTPIASPVPSTATSPIKATSPLTQKLQVAPASKKNIIINDELAKFTSPIKPDKLNSDIKPKGKHFFDSNTEVQMLSCHMCDEIFLRKSDLYIHLEGHGVFIIECNVCDDKFLDMSDLQEHVATAHADNDVTVMANKPQITSSNVPQHLITSVLEEKGGFPCKQCGKVLQHKQSYVSHMKVIHGEYYGQNKWKGSSVVDMILNGNDSQKKSPVKTGQSTLMPQLNLSGLNSQAEGMEDNSMTEESNTCNLCEKSFVNQSILRDHVVNIHIKGFHYMCELCNKGYPNPDSLENHMKAKHPGKRTANDLDSDEVRLDAKRLRVISNNPENNNDMPASEPTIEPLTGKRGTKCNICGIILSHKSNINVHLRTHSGERPYTCVLCSSRFRQKAHLMKHFRCNHTRKIPPFKCSYCDQVYDRSQDLYHHIAYNHTEDLESGDAKKDEIREADSDERHGMITEQFFYEDILINPCYVALPMVNEQDIIDETKSTLELAEEESGEDDENDDSLGEGEYSNEMEARSEVSYTTNNSILEEGPEPGEVILPQNALISVISPNSTNSQNSASHLLESLLKVNMASSIQHSENICTKSDNPDEIDIIESHSPLKPMTALKIMNPKPKSSPPQLISTSKLASQQLSGNNNMPIAFTPIVAKKDQTILNSPGIKDQTITQFFKKIGSAVTSTPNESEKNLALKKNIMDDDDQITVESSQAQSSAVTDYEYKIQNEIWPLECIKCEALLGRLDVFNNHMNDHWTDDKCCPVCGLLINSKRFNFKQHLKIHTGEKPFVCGVCGRAFRQKAHMVKHVTTHRTMPDGSSQSPSNSIFGNSNNSIIGVQ